MDIQHRLYTHNAFVGTEFSYTHTLYLIVSVPSFIVIHTHVPIGRSVCYYNCRLWSVGQTGDSSVYITI